LSLLYPGLGHFYCKKTQSGFVVAALFTVAAALVMFASPAENAMLWGIGLRSAIVVHGFGFLDAFYSAREINAGIDQYMIGNNPRIAAVLNLLTAGFGYFYVGDRTKGLIWFFISRFLYATVGQRLTWIAFAVELACAVVAVDAYFLARKQLREAIGAESTDAFSSSDKGLSPLVPLALGVFLIFNYFLICSLGLLIPKYPDRGRSFQIVSENSSGGSTIQHRSYGVSLHVPAGWVASEPSKEFIMGASNSEYGCQVGLMMAGNLPISGQQGIAQQMINQLKHDNATFQWLSEGPAQIGGKSAYMLNYQATYRNIPVLQKIVFVQHHLTLYSFIEAASVGTADECGPMMDQILASVKLDF